METVELAERIKGRCSIFDLIRTPFFGTKVHKNFLEAHAAHDIAAATFFKVFAFGGQVNMND